MGFYLSCLEAEAAGSVRIHLNDSGHIELTKGPSPVHGLRQLSSGEAVARWCRQREMALGEAVIAGWPMIVGTDQESRRTGLVASPLLIAEIDLTESNGLWSIEPREMVSLNPFALDLLDVDRHERETMVRLVQESAAVEEARTSGDCAAAILSILQEAGVADFSSCDPKTLWAHDNTVGVHNAGLLIVGVSGSTAFNRMLLEDLEELLNRPDLLSSGPAAVMLGQVAAPVASLPAPHTTVVPSSLVQDRAVTSAMEQVLTVVTGPPGTGKSQVLVNVVAAAVARNETVLFASKNNQAVDVVFERLALATSDACMVRAGPASRRSEVAAGIRSILATPPRAVDLAEARRKWAAVAAAVESAHGCMHRRARLEGEVDQLKVDLRGLLETLPERAEVDADERYLDASVEQARVALDAFGRGLGIFGRWEKHQQRLEWARRALSALGEVLALDQGEMEQVLASVADRPRRSLAPRQAFRSIEEDVEKIRRVKRTRANIADIAAELESLPSKQELDDRLHSMRDERIEAGRQLLDAKWEQVRRGDPAARTAAGKLAELLEGAANAGRSARGARRQVVPALAAIPVWGVTNLSARTNLPLEQGLFDLVVIDEASQCDIASAIPLLVRAKRALIIGDRRQLTHISSLSNAREETIARRWGLSEDRLDDFSYRDRSCFGLASSRVDEEPLFLDLHFRSHPAIIGFSNERFYDGRLELCSDSHPPGDLPAIEWTDVVGDSSRGPQGRSFVNLPEARAVAQMLAQQLPEFAGLGLTVGVITPYRAQSELIGDQLHRLVGMEVAREVTVATAHRFQGDERDIIYFSPVLGPSLPDRQIRFVANPNLVNVALTRARRRLVIVGNRNECLTHASVLADLARYVSRLEAGSFDSPLEQTLHEALLDRGVHAQTGVVVAGHRLDLAVVHGESRLDVECDGAPFHTNRDLDEVRDRAIQAEGWQIIRFSGRRISGDLESCVNDVLAALGQ